MPPSRTEAKVTKQGKERVRAVGQDVQCEDCLEWFKASALTQHLRSHSRRKARKGIDSEIEALLGGPQALAATALEKEYGIAPGTPAPQSLSMNLSLIPRPGFSRERRPKKKCSGRTATQDEGKCCLA